MSQDVTSTAEQPMTLLVIGATGMQGGAVAQAALDAGFEVTALVRDAQAPLAQALADKGVRLVVGQLEDVESLRSACQDQSAVFSVQPAPAWKNPDSERVQGRNVAQAAASAGVRHLVHSSVSGTGWRDRHPDVDPGPMANYWASKEDVEAAVRAAGINYTIVKPAFFLDNLIPPKSRHMFPLLAQGELLVACEESTKVAVLGGDDFGTVVAQILSDPERFAGAEIELGSDTRTYPEMAAGISEVTGRPVVASCLPAAEVDERLGGRSWSATQVWLNEVGYPARPESAAAFGLKLDTPFHQWASQHREDLVAAVTP